MTFFWVSVVALLFIAALCAISLRKWWMVVIIVVLLVARTVWLVVSR